MTDTDRTRLLWIAALVVVILGTVLTFRTVRTSRDLSLRLTRKISDLETLVSIQSAIHRGNAAVAAIRTPTNEASLPIGDLLRESLAGQQYDAPTDTRKDGIPGWIVRQKVISLPDASIGKVLEFVRKAECASPAWRLARLSILSAAQTPGTAKIDVTLECVESTARSSR